MQFTFHFVSVIIAVQTITQKKGNTILLQIELNKAFTLAACKDMLLDFPNAFSEFISRRLLDVCLPFFLFFTD